MDREWTGLTSPPDEATTSAERSPAETASTDPTKRPSPERPSPKRSSPERPSTERSSTERSSTERSSTERSSTDPATNATIPSPIAAATAEAATTAHAVLRVVKFFINGTVKAHCDEEQKQKRKWVNESSHNSLISTTLIHRVVTLFD